MMWARLVPTFVAAFAVALTSRAEAQVVSDDNVAQDVIVVSLRANDPGDIRLELYDPTERPPQYFPAAVCIDRCQLTAIPGRYLLRVSGPSGGDVPTSVGYLDLEQTCQVIVDPPSAFGRSFGLALGVVGTTAFAMGLAMAAFGGDDAYGGLARPTFAVGVVAAPAGWILFAANRKPSVEIVRSARP